MWTVIGIGDSIVSPSGQVRSTLVCRCSCGGVHTVLKSNLKRGVSRSCKRCAVSTHGHTRSDRYTKESPEFSSWRHMIERCTNPNHEHWNDYGGRGIRVCERWQRFENFLADMGLKPHPKLTLERVDNELGYYKENCKWATQAEQNANRRGAAK